MSQIPACYIHETCLYIDIITCMLCCSFKLMKFSWNMHVTCTLFPVGRYYGAPVLRDEHTCVKLFLPACTLVTCMSLVLAGVYCVPRLACACTIRLCITRNKFSFACKLAKNAYSWFCTCDTCNFKHEYSAHEYQVQIKLYH